MSIVFCHLCERSGCFMCAHSSNIEHWRSPEIQVQILLLHWRQPSRFVLYIICGIVIYLAYCVCARIISFRFVSCFNFIPCILFKFAYFICFVLFRSVPFRFDNFIVFYVYLYLLLCIVLIFTSPFVGRVMLFCQCKDNLLIQQIFDCSANELSMM